MNSASGLLRAYLRQRRELGETELVLSGVSAEELLNQARRGSAHAAAAVVAPAPPASPVLQPERSIGRVSRAAPLLESGDLAEVRAAALGCTRCGLAEGRSQVVFGEGDLHAELVVVGEAPGADEDRTGRPFVGRAGRLLDLLLISIGISREAVYVCNVLKCRLPRNRSPQRIEIEACSSYLRRQLELVAPRAILTLGTSPSQALLASTESINRLRERPNFYQGIPLIATYDPAALLRNPGWIRPVWDDLQRLRALLDEDPGRD